LRYPNFDDPVYATDFEKRRLRILNSLLRALDRLDVTVSIDGREARTLVAHVGDFSVGFTPWTEAARLRALSVTLVALVTIHVAP
jgi:hypothetical protein